MEGVTSQGSTSQTIVAAVTCGYPVTASSVYNANHGPHMAKLDQVVHPSCSTGWQPAVSDINQWIQVNVTEPKLFVGVTTQGRPTSDRWNQWVSGYFVKYSMDGINWLAVDQAKDFNGNSDFNTKVRNDFLYPVRARVLRICPTRWNGAINMRFEAYFVDE